MLAHIQATPDTALPSRMAKPRYIAGALVCGSLLLAFILSNHAYSFSVWEPYDSGFWALVIAGPIALLLWALLPNSEWRFQAYPWIRRLIQTHAVASAIALAAFIGLLIDVLPRDLLFLFSLFGPLGAAAIVVDVFVLLLTPGARASSADIRSFSRYQLALSGGGVLAVVVWSFLNIGLIIFQAQRIAEGRPYCIEVANDDRGRYKPVASLMAMNGLKMHTPSTCVVGGSTNCYHFAFHALLSIDGGAGIERHNWSYWQQRFVPVSDRTLSNLSYAPAKPSCDRKADFVRLLPLL